MSDKAYRNAAIFGYLKRTQTAIAKSENLEELQYELNYIVKDLYLNFPTRHVNYALAMILDKKFDEVCYAQKRKDRSSKK